MERICVKNLKVEYSDGFIAVNNLSFSLEENSLTALCGLCGSGKTSVAFALCGLVKYSGEIFFDGESPKSAESGLRGVGYLPRELNLFKTSVKKNLTYGCKIRKIKSAKYDERQRIVMEICGIKALSDRKISSLSTEERELVALARLFMRDNLLYIIDCELSEFTDKIIELKNFFNATVLYLSSQNDSLVEKADKKILLRNGICCDESSLYARKFSDPFLNVCELTVVSGIASSSFLNGSLNLADGRYYIAVSSEDIEEGNGAEVLNFERSKGNPLTMNVSGIPYFIYSNKKVNRMGFSKASIFNLNGSYLQTIK